MTATGPNEGQVLRHRTSWTVFGQMFYIATQFGIMVLLARIAGVADLGRFGLASAIVTPVYSLLDLGLRTNKSTDVGNLHFFRDLLALRTCTTILGFAVIFLIALVYLDGPEAMLITVVFGAAKGVEALSDICYGVFERHGEMRRFATSMVTRGCGSLLIFGLILFLTHSAGLAFAGQFVIWSTVLLAHDFRIARNLSADPPGRVHWSNLIAGARASWQLGVAQFIASLQTSVPRFMINWAVGLEAVGIFTAVAYFLQASNMTMTAVSRSVVGRLAELADQAHVQSFRKIIFRYAGPIAVVGILLIPVAWSIGAWVLSKMFGPEFLDQTPLIVLMLVTVVCRALGILFQATAISYRRFNILVRIRIVDLILITVLSFAGVFLAGLPGVAAGLAVSSAILLAIQLAVFLHLTSTRG